MIIINKKFLIAILILTVLTALYSFFIENTYTKTEYNLFDTVSTITVTDRKNNTEKYMDILRDLDSELNAYNPYSPIYKLNHGEETFFSDDVLEHIETALEYSKKLKNYFDITINPVIEIWNEAISAEVLPENHTALHSYLADNFEIEVDKSKNKAKIITEDASIALGATAKGFATKILVNELKSDKVKNAILNLGGNIYAHGTKPDGTPWTVGIANPFNTATSAVILECKDVAIITSGDYQRYFESDGKRYHHIIDPVTLMPADNGIRSATAIGKDPELCDIMSTTLFVAGLDRTKELCLKYGIDAIIISDDTIYYTDGAEVLINSTDEKFALIKL